MSNKPLIIFNPYLDPLDVSLYKRETDGETIAILLSPIPYQTSAGEIIVPTGFDSDGCTMPHFFWRSLGHPLHMDFLREAILHDWLYRVQIFDRGLSDLLFKEQMSEKVEFTKAALRMTVISEMPKGSEKQIKKEYKKRLKNFKLLSGFRINMIYAGLKVGGGFAWKSNFKKLDESRKRFNVSV